MTRGTMMNCWTLLVFTSMLLAFPSVLARPACGAPPPKTVHPAQNKRLFPREIMYPDTLFLYRLPWAEWENYGYPPDFRCAPYVDAANRLQALGKAKACRDLLRLAAWEDGWNDGSRYHHGYRAIVLCRMLFVARAGQPFRRTMTGDANFIGGTTFSDWPLEPIILIDQVPFVIAKEYAGLGGNSESNGQYVQYCIDHCDWSSIKYHPLTKRQENQALQKLYALPVWKNSLSDSDRRFFARQLSPDLAFLYDLPSAEYPYRLPSNWENGDTANWFQDLDFRSAPYVDAAVRLQALNKVKACQYLLQFAEWEDDYSHDGALGFHGYRAIVLCRMLFAVRNGQPFRRAGTGFADFIAGTTYSDWPLEPISLVDQVPFLISLEYINGPVNFEEMYVRYGMDNCDWSSIKYHRLTKSQQEQALQKLYALPVWKGHLTKNSRAFFAHQISPPD